MEILLKDTNQIVTDIEFRNMYPNTSFPQVLVPDILDDFNAVTIMEGAPVTPTSPYEYSQRQGIEEINGKWFTKYVLGPIFTDNEYQTADEQLIAYKTKIDNDWAAQVRANRDRLLKDSDWTQIADVPVYKTAWANYRQELRDITLQESFPFDIIWPEKPTS
jgi:hypothetical protein